MSNKKTIKVRDLKPNKDAKGGGSHAVNRGPSVNHGSVNTTTNTTKQQHGHSHHNN